MSRKEAHESCQQAPLPVFERINDLCNHQDPCNTGACVRCGCPRVDGCPVTKNCAQLRERVQTKIADVRELVTERTRLRERVVVLERLLRMLYEGADEAWMETAEGERITLEVSRALDGKEQSDD